MVFLFTLVITVAACSKEATYLYEVPLEAEFVIPSGLNTIETHYFIIKDVPTYFTQFANDRGVDTSSITNIQSARGLLRGTFQNNDYSFISRIAINIVSHKNPNRIKEMFYMDFVPLNTNEELRMLSSTTELRNILNEEFVDVQVAINVRDFTTTNIPTRLRFSYVVF